MARLDVPFLPVKASEARPAPPQDVVTAALVRSKTRVPWLAEPLGVANDPVTVGEARLTVYGMATDDSELPKVSVVLATGPPVVVYVTASAPCTKPPEA